ncbi:MAG: hypothetical protein R3F43_08310 [bacterium]
MVICGDLLGTPITLAHAQWRLLRFLARDVQWFSRAGRLSIVVGDWTQRERLELSTADWKKHGVRALLRGHPGPPTLGMVAVALAVAWQQLHLQERLEPGRWRRALLGLQRAEEAPAAEAPPGPGTITVVLQRPMDAEHDPLAPLGGLVTLEMAASSRRTGAPSSRAPRPAPSPRSSARWP